MAYLLGIDLGSTTIKAVIYDEQGRMVSEGSRPTLLSHLDVAHPTWAVWEPDNIWGAVCAAVRQALGAVGDAAAVKGVAVTGFGMDGLPLDKSGQPLYPLISWHCPRNNEIAQEFSARIGQGHIFDIAGAQMMTIHSIYRMIWMQQNHPEIMEKTDKWLLIEDYVNFRLCGEKATDYSMAWNTSALDQANKSWSSELIGLAGVPPHIFPDIRPSGTVLGRLTPKAAAETGLSTDTQVVLGGHDYICAALAVGAVDDDVVMDITGTWEMVLQASAKLSHDRRIFDSGYYVENHVARDRYCFVASTVCGDMTEWFKDRLGAEERAEAEKTGVSVWQLLMDKAQQSPAGAHGCFLLPHFSGAGTPAIDANSMGAYIGLHNAVTKGDLIRATIEGLDYQFYGMVEALENALHISPGRICAVGGATKNAFWMQNKADVCNKVIEVPELYEATPLGAAMLAGIGAGVYRDEHEAISSVRRPGIIYEPDKERAAQYAEYYHGIYKNIYGALRDMHHTISRKFR
jgi:xylulokinase